MVVESATSEPGIRRGWFGREQALAGVALTVETELGYTFDPAVWGWGLATEASRCLRDDARDVLRLPYRSPPFFRRTSAPAAPLNGRAREPTAKCTWSASRGIAGSGPSRSVERRRAMYDPHVSRAAHPHVRPDEIEQVWRVHVASSSGLAVRRGRPARPTDDPVSTDARAVLASEPDGYFCAIEDGRSEAWCRRWSADGCGTCRCSSCSRRPRARSRTSATRAGAGLRRGARRGGALCLGLARPACPGPLRDGRDGAAMADLPLGGRCPRGGAAQSTGRDRPACVGAWCDPGAAETQTAEVFGHGRADDLAHWRSDGGAAVASAAAATSPPSRTAAGIRSGRRQGAMRRRSSRRWRPRRARAPRGA